MISAVRLPSLSCERLHEYLTSGLIALCEVMLTDLMYPDSKDCIFNRVISDIFVVQRESTLTISGSIETGSPVKTENK